MLPGVSQDDNQRVRITNDIRPWVGFQGEPVIVHCDLLAACCSKNRDCFLNPSSSYAGSVGVGVAALSS